MDFIKHSDIQVGDVIAWAFDRSITCGSSIIYYEIDSVERNLDLSQTIVYGKSYGSSGERWKDLVRKWDYAPNDRDILLISRKENK